MSNPAARRLAQPARLALDLGPLVLFFVVLRLAGIFAATGAFMVAVGIALATGFAVERRVSPIPVITAAVVMVFGGLTLYLHDKTFIKLKPTIIYLIFAFILAAGAATGRNFIRLLFDQAFHLTETGWRQLTYRWIGFFIVMAILNEIIWRNFSDTFWAGFKIFGAIPLTFLFAAAQVPLVLKHEIKEKTEA